MKRIIFLFLAVISIQFISCNKSGTDGSNNPLPILAEITPGTAIVGSGAITITASGNNFVDGSVIQWNGESFTTGFVSKTKLTAVVPAADLASITTAVVRVYSPSPGGGVSGTMTFTVTSNGYEPEINTTSPNETTAGSSGFTLYVSGINFVNGSVINWNGSALATTYIDAFHLSTFVPSSNISLPGTASITVVNPLPTGLTSSPVNFPINSTATGKRFLFDATHGETAGNADWVIDEDNSTPQTTPTPAQITVTSITNEDYWTGAISSWGIALVQLNNTVETLAAGSAVTFGNSTNSHDLSNYDVFIVDEPNNVFSAAEKTAILNFVHAGGGLLMVSDHTMSDRDGDGWDSPAIWNDLMSNNTVQNNPFGFTIDLQNYSEVSSNILTGSNAILNGSAGSVSQIQFNGGTTATINPAVNPAVHGLIWTSSSSQNNNNIMSLSSAYGSGKVFFIGDSSPTDDGTGDPSNTLYGGWNNYNHKQLFLNASLWLANL